MRWNSKEFERPFVRAGPHTRRLVTPFSTSEYRSDTCINYGVSLWPTLEGFSGFSGFRSSNSAGISNKFRRTCVVNLRARCATSGLMRSALGCAPAFPTSRT